jgi:excisionase family DNA binding protein
MRKFLTIDDLSSQWQIPKRTVYKFAQEGRIPGAMKFGRHWRFRADMVERWIESQTNGRSTFSMKKIQ